MNVLKITFKKYKKTAAADSESCIYNACSGIFCDGGSYISGEYVPVADVIE